MIGPNIKIDKRKLTALAQDLSNTYNFYSTEEVIDLLTSAIRLNIGISIEKVGRKKAIELIDEELVAFFKNQVLPNTLILNFEDRDVIELMLFSIEFAFSMFEGKTKATTTQKGFRERKREIETIILNTFTGLVGEVAVKRFLENKFNKNVHLDRTISTNIEEYRSDILYSSVPISIKTSPNLSAVWAECPPNYKVGIFVKASTPKAVLLSLFAKVCGFRNLLDFSKNILGSSELIEGLNRRIYAQKCGDLHPLIKCYICGYMETENLKLVEEGTKLPYLGKVRETRYILPLNELKNKIEDWKEFCEKYL